jgi:hypothetical protein
MLWPEEPCLYQNDPANLRLHTPGTEVLIGPRRLKHICGEPPRDPFGKTPSSLGKRGVTAARAGNRFLIRNQPRSDEIASVLLGI